MGNVRQELEDVKTAAAMSEQAKQDEIASVRQQYEQEISSMQQLLGGEFIGYHAYHNFWSFLLCITVSLLVIMLTIISCLSCCV